MPHSKYNSRIVTVDEIKFDSNLEAECFLHFRDGCKRLGLELELQPKFELIPTQRPLKGKTLKKHTYTGDFRITGEDTDILIDVKSKATAEKQDFKINEKLMLHKYDLLIKRIYTPNEAADLMRKLSYG